MCTSSWHIVASANYERMDIENMCRVMVVSLSSNLPLLLFPLSSLLYSSIYCIPDFSVYASDALSACS